MDKKHSKKQHKPATHLINSAARLDKVEQILDGAAFRQAFDVNFGVLARMRMVPLFDDQLSVMLIYHVVLRIGTAVAQAEDVDHGRHFPTDVVDEMNEKICITTAQWCSSGGVNLICPPLASCSCDWQRCFLESTEIVA